MEVAWLYVAPVKGLRIEEREQIELGRSGVVEDRRFCIVDETGRLVNGKRFAPLTRVSARFDPQEDRLELRMPDGRLVAERVTVGDPIVVTIYGHQAAGRLVDGSWAAALSEEFGRPLRVVRLDAPGNGHDRARLSAGATLLSVASLDRLRREGAIDEPVDPRRFRMLIGVAGTAPHEEDSWIGRRVRVGGAVVAPLGNVGRCVVTTRDPETADPDLDTLGLLARYRRGIGSTEELAFGVWAQVERPGRVRLGDDVCVEDRA